MNLRIVQQGSGASRVVVACYRVEEHCDRTMRAALGAAPCIVAYTDVSAIDSLKAMLAAAQEKGAFTVSGVAFIGWLGVGKERIAQLMKEGAKPIGVQLREGPQDQQETLIADACAELAKLKELAPSPVKGETPSVQAAATEATSTTKVETLKTSGSAA